MNPREKGEAMVMTPFCDFFIREYHEFFDELVSIIAFAFLDIYWSFCLSNHPLPLRYGGRPLKRGIGSASLDRFKVKIDFCRLKCDFPFFSPAFFEDMVETEDKRDDIYKILR